jgi:P-type conjugative transfer protein TrbJ
MTSESVMTFSTRKVLSAVIATALTIATPMHPAQAQFAVIDVANLLQNYLNGAQEILTAARTLQSNINEAEMIANEIKNLKNLPQDIVGAYQWRFQRVLWDLQRLTQLVGNYYTLSQMFAARYPNLRDSQQNSANLFALQAQWSDQYRDNLLQALQQGASVLDDLRDSTANTQSMAYSSQGAVGALQAIQAGNQLTMRVNEDLDRLNTQVATFNGAVLEKMAREQSENDAAESMRRELHAHDTDPYFSNPARDPRY